MADYSHFRLTHCHSHGESHPRVVAETVRQRIIGRAGATRRVVVTEVNGGVDEEVLSQLPEPASLRRL